MILVKDEILKATGATSILAEKAIQSLWSDYGEIKKYDLNDGRYPSVIVKHIYWKERNEHPKGWDSQISHDRKLKSYQIEMNWYQKWAQKSSEYWRIPANYMTLEEEEELLLIMEDLDAAGFYLRVSPENVTLENAKICLSWLAHFHARFMGESVEDLWPIGTYWHLDTRPDELKKMNNMALKRAASAIGERLNNAKYQTIVHGDAKLANFCFSEADTVAAVDFQYVGGGCGMKDVAYFISSCFEENDCEKYETDLLDYYFNQLEKALEGKFEFKEVKQEWLSLYKYAWADFYRFLDGWSPGHWKMNGYSQRLTNEALSEL
ncbi:MAG: phosphotransferase [Ekhidna sp.]